MAEQHRDTKNRVLDDSQSQPTSLNKASEAPAPTVVLADDHTLVRAGIRSLIEASLPLRVVGETGDGAAVIGLVEQLAPDMLLLDLAMPGMHGMEIIRICCQRFPKTRVLVLSMHAESEYVRESLAAGAAGFLVKDAAPEELPLAVRAVLDDNTFVSPRLSTMLFGHHMRRGVDQAGDAAPRRALVTPRQREVLRHLGAGLGTREIAEVMHVSVKTVETHRARIMETLNIPSANALVHYAVRGHFDVEDD